MEVFHNFTLKKNKTSATMLYFLNKTSLVLTIALGLLLRSRFAYTLWSFIAVILQHAILS
jgi:hypothetical protein